MTSLTQAPGRIRIDSRYQLFSRINQRIIDAAIFGISFYLAYQIRFASQVPPVIEHQMWLLLVPIMLVGLMITSLFGVYQLVWCYINLADAIRIARSHVVFFSLIFFGCFIVPEPWALLRIPRSVILIHFLITLVAAPSVRALRRITHEWLSAKRSSKETPIRVVLVGAGRAGMMLAKEIASGRNIQPVGFLDDDPQVIGTKICGLRVLGSVDCLPEVVRKHEVDQVIISVAKEQQTLLRRVWVFCEELSVRVRVVPTLDEVLSNKINISAFRDIEMGSLMDREPIQFVFNEETAAVYQGRRILITGAGGSIGSELACQLAGLGPQELILLDKDENGLHDTWLRVQSCNRVLSVQPIVADLRFVDRLQRVFASHRPDVVFHAAAHKHVPLMEINPCEAILNNVAGTRNVVEACLAFSVFRFVLISTDKAVKPSSIMGASKRVCEMIVQSHSGSENCRFCCVRFGNVLGSRGSVLPTFQKQMRRGEPITITHEAAQRYLMTIPEAVSLLIQAATLGAGGETYVLDMGEPVLIWDLANRLIERCGLRPGRDVPVEITRLRPGEKLCEQVFDESTETLLPTGNPKINMIQKLVVEAAHLTEKVTALEIAARENRAADINRILRDLKIGFCAQQAAMGAAELEEPVYQGVDPPVPTAPQVGAAKHV